MLANYLALQEANKEHEYFKIYKKCIEEYCQNPSSVHHVSLTPDLLQMLLDGLMSTSIAKEKKAVPSSSSSRQSPKDSSEVKEDYASLSTESVSTSDVDDHSLIFPLVEVNSNAPALATKVYPSQYLGQVPEGFVVAPSPNLTQKRNKSSAVTTSSKVLKASTAECSARSSQQSKPISNIQPSRASDSDISAAHDPNPNSAGHLASASTIIMNPSSGSDPPPSLFCRLQCRLLRQNHSP
ncbi:uncharacterized protein LOC133822840 [Humulus lupulus]|uniref:uncharacterized protein LOC133822840 n=1 Tax=Humulus lupulus TaxID=3486 RepID=UPI002B404A73|nr:uncharacterized protein LOC133822840 [Humulus lupulus]